MNNTETIQKAYRTTTQHTLEAWHNNPGTGKKQPPNYNKAKYGISSGERFQTPSELRQFHSKLLEFSANDPVLDTTPPDCLHFSFLALAHHNYNTREELPKQTTELKTVHDKTVGQLNYTITDLQILPLKNSFLLAGFPNKESFQTREKTAQNILKSTWEPYIRDRYKGYPIPPLFWHTTLARYEAEYLPQKLRWLYHQFAKMKIPTIQLGTPKLRATSYNWQKAILL